MFPLPKTVAVLNMDTLFPFGAYDGMTTVGLGSSELEDYMRDAARAEGRILTTDPAPEQGAFFRSDHYPLARRGVPALFAVGGPVDDSDTTMAARFQEYVTKHITGRPMRSTTPGIFAASSATRGSIFGPGTPSRVTTGFRTGISTVNSERYGTG